LWSIKPPVFSVRISNLKVQTVDPNCWTWSSYWNILEDQIHFFLIGEKNTSIRWCRNHKYRLRLWCFAKYKIFRISHSYLKFKSLNDWFKPLNMIFILKYILRSNETWQILYFTKHHSPPLSIYIFPSPSKLMKGKTIFF
jgi:hypothetical protein